MKKENKEKLKKVPAYTLKELDDRDGITHDFRHLDGPLDRYAREQEEIAKKERENSE